MLAVSAYHNMNLRKRLVVLGKFVSRAAPYYLIARKPRELMTPRAPDHLFRAVADKLAAQQASVDAFGADLEPAVADYFHLVERGEIDEAGGHFWGIDAACAYAAVRKLEPRLIVEIGCGQSTRVMRRALGDAGCPDARIVCIDPAPRKDVAAVADEVVSQSALRADAGIFEALGAGDVLFVDGSHYAFNGTDVVYLFLEVFPRLAAGVVVHVHDIFLPYEYPKVFTDRLYNEQYLLAALIMDERSWEVLLPVHALCRSGRFGPGRDGGSFWMRRL